MEIEEDISEPVFEDAEPTPPSSPRGAAPEAGAAVEKKEEKETKTEETGVKFRDHFWGHDPAACYHAAAGVEGGSSASDREGLDVLERATGVSVDVAAELAAFLAERAEAEEQYAKRLRRLAGAAEGADEGASTAFGAAREDVSAGLQALLAAAAEEARTAAAAHRAVGDAYSAAAAAVRDLAKGYKAARKGLLGDAAAATREKAQLEGAVRKQAARYAEAVARKDAAAAAVATLAAQGRAPQDVAKQRARAQRCAKDEMVADQGVKEAVDRLAACHPAWVARMQALMDGLQAHEEQRLAGAAAALARTAAAQLDAAPGALAAAQHVADAAGALDPVRELAPWVQRAHTGAVPSRPPVYLPRSSRARPTDAVADAGALGASHSSGNSSGNSSGSSSSGRRSSGEGTAGRGGCARVLRMFVGEEADELDLFVGDVVDVLAECTDVGSGGWWIGRCRGRVGWFPAAFVELQSA